MEDFIKFSGFVFLRKGYTHGFPFCIKDLRKNSWVNFFIGKHPGGFGFFSGFCIVAD